MNRGITVHQRKAAFLLIVFFAPFFSDMYGVEPIGSASAAIDDCGGDLSPIVWNETISRHAEVPFTIHGFGMTGATMMMVARAKAALLPKMTQNRILQMFQKSPTCT